MFDDHNLDTIDVNPNPDIVDNTQLCFSTESLNPSYCNTRKNVYDQDNQMTNIILLGEKDLNYL